MLERGSILGPGTQTAAAQIAFRAFVFVRPVQLFTNAQVRELSTAILIAGFDATMAAMSLAE